MSKKNAYAKYMQTDKWKIIKTQRMSMDNNECVLCGEKAEHVHHRRYPKEWGTETVSDLVSLCSDCHVKHHGDDCDSEEKKVIELMCSYEGLCPIVEDAIRFVEDGAKSKEDLNGYEMLEVLDKFALLCDAMMCNFSENSVPSIINHTDYAIREHVKEEHSK